MADKKVRIGVIGHGNMGSGHVSNLLHSACPEATLTAVADINPKKLESLKDVKGNFEGDPIKLYTDASEMIRSGDVDAVIVAVPHYDHPRYVIEALENGVHALSEKPAGVYTQQVKEMNAVAEKHPELVFGMMFNQRTDPAYRKMKEIIDSGEMGQIRRTNWIITTWYRTQSYYDSGDWRATWSGEGGGVLLNQCPHQLDLFQWICGLPVKVMAKMQFGKWHDIEVEDDVTAFVEYENGATGAFITTTGDTPGTNRFEVTLEYGKLVYENGKLRQLKLERSIDEYTYNKDSAAFGSPKVIFDDFVPCPGENTQHVGILNSFAASILHGVPLIAPGVEGIRGLTLSNAMHLSQWLGREVEIPFDDQLYKDELMKRVATSRRKTDVREQTVTQWATK
ncbi:MAG: Gfo/Idh/MocA family oxidoreductase [Clostridia bacterium]|nr:Gfo/Idh/MocA family oxidoreductase [Clostridia bacterium]